MGVIGAVAYLGIGFVFSIFAWDSPVTSKKDEVIRKYVVTPIIIVGWGPIVVLAITVGSVIGTVLLLGYSVSRIFKKE